MKRKKPQSADSHLYDKRALTYLKSVLPEHWKYIPVGDEDSQIEYGQDRIVQLTDEANQLDGAEFRVQNKGTKRKITKNGLSIRMAVSTLNYLRDLPLPVLLHFYHDPTHIGYWMWLDDLFSQSNAAEWQKGEEVLVHIPSANVLNIEASEQIRQRVLSLCRLQALIKHAQSETLNDRDYFWELEFRGDGFTINQRPKHPEAPPMLIDPNLSEELRSLIETAWETGITVRLNGTVPLQGVPDWVKQIFEGKEMEFFRTPPERVIYNQFRFYKHAKDKKPFYDTGPIEMRFMQQGSKVSRVEGIGSDGVTIFGMAVDLRNTEQIGKRFKVGGGVYLMPNTSVTDAVRLDECFSFIENLMSAEKILFHDPLKHMTIPLEHSSGDFGVPVEQQMFRDMVHALAIIQRELGLAIPVPKTWDEIQFRNARFVAHVLQTGKSPFLLLDWSGDGPRPDHLQLLATVANDDDIQHVLADTSIVNEQRTLPGAPEFVLEVLEHQIRLGPTEQVMKVMRCLNADDLRQKLTTSDVFGKTLDVFWEVNWDESYTKFPNFSKD